MLQSTWSCDSVTQCPHQVSPVPWDELLLLDVSAFIYKLYSESIYKNLKPDNIYGDHPGGLAVECLPPLR